MEKGWTLTKKVSSYLTYQSPDAMRAYYDKLSSIKMRMESEVIDLVVRPSMSMEILPWCGVSIYAFRLIKCLFLYLFGAP